MPRFLFRLPGRRAVSWLFALYPWIKALHIASVVFWMAGMLYLPRLFIYHLETAPGAADSERFKVMERRLLRSSSTRR